MIEAPRIACSGGTPSIVEWGPHTPPRGPHSLWAIQVQLPLSFGTGPAFHTGETFLLAVTTIIRIA